MIGLTFNVANIDAIIQVYDEIQIIRYDTVTDVVPETPIGDPIVLTDWVVVSGTVSGTSSNFSIPVSLVSGQTFYQTYDANGDATDWYSSRYFDTTTGTASAWSTPVLGSDNDLLYDPIYVNEMIITKDDQAIIDQIRIYIGDAKRLRRDFGEEAKSSIHPDGKTYELAEKGWPVSINIGGKTFTNINNPSINGYKYLKFQETISDVCVTHYEEENICGDTVNREVEAGVDIWYHTFRHSDKQILDIYKACPIPAGLTTTTVTSQAYMLQTAIDILTEEYIEDATEDGAVIKDEGSSYDPSPGLIARKGVIDTLKKRLNAIIKSLTLTGITGVLVD